MNFILANMPGETPIQGQEFISNSVVNSVATSPNTTNSKRSSLSSACSSLSPTEIIVKSHWKPIERNVSHCDSEPSTPHPSHSGVAVKPYHLVTNSPNQIWVDGPPTPPSGDVSPNIVAIKLLQSLAAGQVIIQGKQVSHVKGVIKQTVTEVHTLLREPKPINDDNDCKIVHVEEGDEPIGEMLAKQINYGNKMKYVAIMQYKYQKSRLQRLCSSYFCKVTHSLHCTQIETFIFHRVILKERGHLANKRITLT